MAKKKDRPFDKLYAELEDIKDARGNLMNTVLFSKNGNWSVIIEIENPVQQYCTDAASIMAMPIFSTISFRRSVKAIASKSRTSSAVRDMPMTSLTT